VSEHNPDLNPSLDEIESHAAMAARFWLFEAENAIEEEIADAKRFPAGMLGFILAAAIQYHAERQIDAAGRIGKALESLAAAIREQGGRGDGR
jgi:hypothetical protein